VGILFFNEHPIIVLFDSKATLTLVVSGAPYMISTPEGQVHTHYTALKVPLELS
jgi:hypothetical protein